MIRGRVLWVGETARLVDYLVGARAWRALTLDGRVVVVPHAWLPKAGWRPAVRPGEWIHIDGETVTACEAPPGRDPLKGLVRT